ncbi:MAG: PAS domain S-box protein [Chloroflexi bacterium]|jgi:PAS domain S-box-containing protein|nr:PAS domain S-box protein [Chloroflexota bacterium]
MDKSTLDLIEIIQFIENVSTKIHGLRDGAEIFKVVNEEFSQSNHYVASILLLVDNGSSLKVLQSSLGVGVLRAMEKTVGMVASPYKIDLSKSSIFRRVAKDGETVQATDNDILDEIFPQPLAGLLVKVMGIGKEPSIITPIRRHGEIIGVMTMTSPRLVELFIPSVRNLAGHISIALELADEYTERRQVEDTLKESEGKYRAIIENAGTPITYYDLEGRFLLINTIGAANLGGVPDDFVGKTLHDVVPGVAAPAMKRIGKIALSRVGKEYEDFVEYSSCGYWLRSSMQPVRDARGEINAIQVISQDITERKRVEEALRGSQERLKEIFESANDAILYVDQSGIIVGANRKLEDISGKRREEIQGKSFSELGFLESEDMAALVKQFSDAMESGEVQTLLELETRHKNGHMVYFEASTSLRRNNGKVGGALVILRNITERKEAEQRLRDSERRFRALIENAADAITLLMPDGTIFYQSPSIERIAGYKPNDVIGTSMDQYLHPDDLPAVIDKFAHVGSTLGAIESLEVRLKRIDGTWCWVEGVANNLLDEPGVRAIVCNYHDITERKQAEEALRESEGKWRSLAENVPEIITTVNRDGIIMFVNHTAVGVSPGKAIGTSFYRYLIPEYREATRRAVDRAFRTGEAAGEYEVQANDANGSAQWYACRVGPVRQGGEVVAVNLVATDVTERKNSEEEVMQRNRELNALNAVASIVNQSLTLEEILNNVLDKVLDILNIRNVGVTLIETEAKSSKLEVHRGISIDLLEALSRLKVSESIVGRVIQSEKPIFLKCFPDLADLIGGKAYQKMVAEEQLKSIMFVPLQARGKVLGVMYAMTHGARTFSSEEQELLTTIGLEISTAVENAQLIDEASRAEALEELDRLRTELLASVSHELRTPLTVIKGIAGTLVQPDVEWDTEVQKDFLKTINLESDRLTHIVEDLMDMSQLEAGIMKMEKKQGKISTIVNQLRGQLKTLTKDHRFKATVPKSLPAIYIDEIRIGEVITNLVENAAAYSEKGTRIQLDAERLAKNIVVHVVDQGIGIQDEHIDKIFDRFYRLESGVARRRGGTGLGLSICKGIVEAHDGMIWVESNDDKGSRFSFSLPILESIDDHKQA